MKTRQDQLLVTMQRTVKRKTTTTTKTTQMKQANRLKGNRKIGKSGNVGLSACLYMYGKGVSGMEGWMFEMKRPKQTKIKPH